MTLEQRPALPYCHGEQWSVNDEDLLAELCAEVLIGRAFHAARILEGVQRTGTAPVIIDGLKQKLRTELHPQSEQTVWHRDGVLFEIICWIAAKLSASPNEAIADPHLKATNQGTDGLKVTIDPVARTLSHVTVYEFKCTTRGRARFLNDVLGSFGEYVRGERDHQLAQGSLSLLSQFAFTPDERQAVYDRLVQDRPLGFQASITVEPAAFTDDQRLGLFERFETIVCDVERRGGNTLPLANVRKWFADFSDKVWARIEQFNVRR